jgi:hypothetical protein
MNDGSDAYEQHIAHIFSAIARDDAQDATDQGAHGVQEECSQANGREVAPGQSELDRVGLMVLGEFWLRTLNAKNRFQIRLW